MPDPPLNPLRHPLIHDIEPYEGYQDDIITLNTQISTQYDGLRHFPYSTNASQSSYQCGTIIPLPPSWLTAGRFYNDLLTFSDIMVPGGSSTLGIQNAAQKGVAGRGILLDWGGWMESKNASFDAFTTIKIPPTDLDAVAQWQGLDPTSFTRPGDFLVVRMGFTKQYNALSVHEQDVLPFRQGADMQWVGADASDATLRWLWEKKLSIVGSDNPTYESAPLIGTIESPVPRSLHQVFIGGWGQSIVEFLDLEALAVACHDLKRYSFFFTLQNLNVIGGIASPPNIMAIL